MFYEVFHLVVPDDNVFPKDIRSTNKFIRSISRNYDSTQCFKIVEFDDNNRAVSERWLECNKDGKLSVSHRRYYYEL